MAQTNLTIRIDEDIKRDAEIVFERIGLTMSAAINIFFRQAVRTQAIPFELKAYDDYFNEYNMKRILHSIEQAKSGQVITKTLADLEEMVK